MLNSAVFKVCVEGLEFYGHHGVSPEEREVGRHYVADLELDVAGTADETDRIEETVDYGEAVALILAVSEEKRYSTLERLSKAMADRLLERFAMVTEVRIKVAKLLPPLPQHVRNAAVELTVTRPV
jgi:7,8-dihydroneopterin aldolase/epimerase/oxygenase